MGILKLAARRFVAGDRIDEAMKAVRRLNARNIMATIDFLGENVVSRDDAVKAANEYLLILDQIKVNGLRANVSIKLTMMGLEIDDDFCYENVKRIVERAAELNTFVRIDMEGSPVTQRTLDIFLRLYEDYKNVGIVIQSALHRSEADVAMLNEKQASIRLCKGAYKEPPEIAFPKKEQVNENYLKLAETILTNGKFCAIATHDRNMIGPLRAFIASNNISKDRYEWQMLYGIERKLQEKLAKEGEAIRVYVPYGIDWIGYFSRRMMERKENLFFALKHLFAG